MGTPISRCTVLGGTVAPTVLGTTLPSTPAYAAEVQIADSATNPTVVLVAVPESGYVKVLDGGGVHRFNLTTFEYAYMSGDDKIILKTTGITSVVLNGAQQFTVTYTAPIGQVVGTFTVGLWKARVRWDVTGVANLRADSFRLARVVMGTATEDYDPVALWNRDRDPDTGELRGGIPFETTNGVWYSYTWSDNILWSRKDGYILNDDPARRIATNTEYYRTPEPWEDMWPTKTAVTVPTPAAATSVRELNCLGMDVAMHQASNAQVTVTLDGSPRIFIGLALPLLSTGGTS